MHRLIHDAHPAAADLTDNRVVAQHRRRRLRGRGPCIEQLQTRQAGSQPMSNRRMPGQQQLGIDGPTALDIGQVRVEHADDFLVLRTGLLDLGCSINWLHQLFSITSPSRSSARIHNIRTAPAERPMLAAISSKLRPSKCRNVITSR